MTQVTRPDPDTDPVPLTVFDRLAAAGLDVDRIEHHLGAGRVELDGVVVTDPMHPAPRAGRLVLLPI